MKPSQTEMRREYQKWYSEFWSNQTTWCAGWPRPSGRGALGVAEPDTPEPPDGPEEPEPPLPDYAPVIEMLENNLARLETAGMAVGAAVVETHELIDRLKAGESL